MKLENIERANELSHMRVKLISNLDDLVIGADRISIHKNGRHIFSLDSDSVGVKTFNDFLQRMEEDLKAAIKKIDEEIEKL